MQQLSQEVFDKYNIRTDDFLSLFTDLPNTGVVLVDVKTLQFWCSKKMISYLNIGNIDNSNIHTMFEIFEKNDTKELLDIYKSVNKKNFISNIYKLKFRKSNRCLIICDKAKLLKNEDNQEFLVIFVTLMSSVNQFDKLLGDKKNEDFNISFNHNIDFICLVDLNFNIKNVNPAFTKKVGISKQKLTNKSFLELIHPDDRELVEKGLSKTVECSEYSGLCCRFNCFNNDSNFDSNYLLLNLKYVPLQNTILITGRDVKTSEEIKEQNIKLERSIALEKVKSGFFTHVSHEFKTPLNIILSSLELLKTKMVINDSEMYKTEYERYCNYIELNAFKLLKLTINMIDATKIDNGFIKLNPSMCDFEKLICEVAKNTECYASKKNITIKYINQTHSVGNIFCDIDKIDRIMLNLISNAIKNTAEYGEIIVTLTEDDDFYKVSIKDNGIGIPDNLIPGIFEKFSINGTHLVKHCDGSGIGLSIASALIDMHKGSIGVNSKVGIGSDFYFTISKNLLNEEEVKVVNILKASDYEIQSIRDARLKIEMSDLNEQIYN